MGVVRSESSPLRATDEAVCGVASGSMLCESTDGGGVGDDRAITAAAMAKDIRLVDRRYQYEDTGLEATSVENGCLGEAKISAARANQKAILARDKRSGMFVCDHGRLAFGCDKGTGNAVTFAMQARRRWRG